MSSLVDLQHWMAEAIRLPAMLTDGHARRAEALVVPSQRGMTAVGRVEVYREQFWLRHLKNVAEDYPTLSWALGGGDAFIELARAYLDIHPPRTWDLQRLGASMPAFVACSEKCCDNSIALDAARLDWAFMEVFDAPDAPAFDATVLGSMAEDDWPNARVQMHPALRLLELRYPLLDVRDALKAGTDVDKAPRPAPTFAVVWRDAACFSRSMPIERHAFDLLTRLGQGETLGLACAEVTRADSGLSTGAEEAVAAWFQDWVQRGWITGLSLSAA